jgi:hypothetical protein
MDKGQLFFPIPIIGAILLFMDLIRVKNHGRWAMM